MVQDSGQYAKAFALLGCDCRGLCYRFSDRDYLESVGTMSFNIPQAKPITQYVQPTTGQTVTVGPGNSVCLCLDPAGTLLTLTCALPSSPSDGDVFSICSSQIITTFSMTGGTIVGALTTVAVATFASYTYFATPGKWYRSG